MKGLDLHVSDVMSHPRLLGPHFAGPSWSTWKAVVRAAFAEKMSDEEIAAFHVVAERAPPKKRVSELVAIVGRGGGKDSIAALMVTAIAVNFDPRGKLRPGEKAVVMCIAVDREQAQIVTDYIKANFAAAPALQALVTSIDRDGLSLRNGVQIVVMANSYRSVRGRSILACVCDEVAFWKDENSASPDVEVALAVQPGLARVKHSMLILISSAHRRSGLLYERFKRGFAQADDDLLVVKGSTLQFNPSADASIIERHLAEDGPRYQAEYNSQWRDDLSTFISRDLVEAAVDPGVTVRPPVPGTSYVCFADPSGGRSDSFTFCVAHRWQDGSVAVDLLYERKPPFSPSDVWAEIAELARSYGCQKIVGDNYAAEMNIDGFARVGMPYERYPRPASDIYLDALVLFTSGRAHLIENDRNVAQWTTLERRTIAGSRDRVVHAKNCHDDLANACAGALVLASTEEMPMRIDANVLAQAAIRPNYMGPRRFTNHFARTQRRGGRLP